MEENENAVPEPVTPDAPEHDLPEGYEGTAEGLYAHFEALRAEAQALQLDWDEALRDPAFVRLTAPLTGVAVGDAWAALHRAELEAKAEARGAQEAKKRLAQAVSGAAIRPREGGGFESAALTRCDYAALSRPERLALKQRIREAAARGEKIFP